MKFVFVNDYNEYKNNVMHVSQKEKKMLEVYLEFAKQIEGEDINEENRDMRPTVTITRKYKTHPNLNDCLPSK